MKGSTTSSGKHRGGGMYKDSTHSSQADGDKWRHDGYDSILQEEKELEKSFGSKKSIEYNSQRDQ